MCYEDVINVSISSWQVASILGWLGSVTVITIWLILYWQVFVQATPLIYLSAVLLPITGFSIAYGLAKILCRVSPEIYSYVSRVWILCRVSPCYGTPYSTRLGAMFGNSLIGCVWARDRLFSNRSHLHAVPIKSFTRLVWMLCQLSP